MTNKHATPTAALQFMSIINTGVMPAHPLVGPKAVSCTSLPAGMATPHRITYPRPSRPVSMLGHQPSTKRHARA